MTISSFMPNLVEDYYRWIAAQLGNKYGQLGKIICHQLGEKFGMQVRFVDADFRPGLSILWLISARPTGPEVVSQCRWRD
jgi:hypothetical protein